MLTTFKDFLNNIEDRETDPFLGAPEEAALANAYTG